jgi:hypothetical protein
MHEKIRRRMQALIRFALQALALAQAQVLSLSRESFSRTAQTLALPTAAAQTFSMTPQRRMLTSLHRTSTT